MLPILGLSAALYMNAREVLDFADKERAGVSTLRSLMPVFESVLEVRNATRSGLGGFDAAADYRSARDKTDKAISALRRPSRPTAIRWPCRRWSRTRDGLAGHGQRQERRRRERPHRLRPGHHLAGGTADQGGRRSQPGARPLPGKLLPGQCHGAGHAGCRRDLGQAWGWGTFALAKGGLDDKSAKRYAAWSSNAESKLVEARSHFARAIKANAGLAQKVDLAPLDAALAFQKSATGTVESGKGDAAKLYADGKAATTGLFKVYASGLSALDDLLAARMHKVRQTGLIELAW